MKEFTNRDIADYYDQTREHYKIHWKLDKNLSVHLGFYETGKETFAAALQNLNKLVAEAGKIKEGEYFLDAGCGEGGSSVYLAKNYKARGEGLTVSEKQAAKAKENAEKFGVKDYLNFKKGDYLATGFPDNTFDLVFGLESILYANDKKDFIKEAFRVLKPGGRLVVVDYFKRADKLPENEQKELDAWTKGWAVNNLESGEGFRRICEETGFVKCRLEDYSKNIVSSVKRILWAGILGWPVGKYYQWFKNPTRAQLEHLRFPFPFYSSFKKGIWKYQMIYAEKAG